MWESCRTILVVGGFSMGSPVCSPFHSSIAAVVPRRFGIAQLLLKVTQIAKLSALNHSLLKGSHMVFIREVGGVYSRTFLAIQVVLQKVMVMTSLRDKWRNELRRSERRYVLKTEEGGSNRNNYRKARRLVIKIRWSSKFTVRNVLGGAPYSSVVRGRLLTSLGRYSLNARELQTGLQGNSWSLFPNADNSCLQVNPPSPCMRGGGIVKYCQSEVGRPAQPLKASSKRLLRLKEALELTHCRVWNAENSNATLPDFGMWESCRTMSLVGGFSRASPFPPSLCFPALLHTSRCKGAPKSLPFIPIVRPIMRAASGVTLARKCSHTSLLDTRSCRLPYRKELGHSFTQLQLTPSPEACRNIYGLALTIWKVKRTPSPTERTMSSYGRQIVCRVACVTRRLMARDFAGKPISIAATTPRFTEAFIFKTPTFAIAMQIDGLVMFILMANVQKSPSNFLQIQVHGCASKVKKRVSDTGDTSTPMPHRSYAQGVQCFRRGTEMCKLDLQQWGFITRDESLQNKLRPYISQDPKSFRHASGTFMKQSYQIANTWYGLPVR
ncbi:hypothetical protein PR048_008164 [Dryococelus australis]|uniref:Uncharacterized protein n=1 Tax=Dryococelus australis TaxID=614101 RepID=A0ABQ9HWB8_9NEOP|nr:hypothetical protein PR048_008164 [Dryococelus australis]